MKFEEYNPVLESGGCIPRALSKFFKKDYNQIKKELTLLAHKMNYKTYQEVEVFERYLKNNNVYKIPSEKVLVKDLVLENGAYLVFAYKNDFYHLMCIINNTLYDKNMDGLELQVISLYKM